MICVSAGTGKLTANVGATLQDGIITLVQDGFTTPPPTLPNNQIYVMDLPEMDPPPDQADYNYFITELFAFFNGYVVNGETVAQAIDLTSPTQFPDSNQYQFRFKFRTSLLPPAQVNSLYSIRYWDIGQFHPRYVRETTATLNNVSDNFRARFSIDSNYIELFSDSTGTVMRGSDGTTDEEIAFSFVTGSWYIAVIDVDGANTVLKVYADGSPEPFFPQISLTTGIDQVPQQLRVDWSCFFGSVNSAIATLELGPIDLCDHGSFGDYPSIIGDISPIPSGLGRLTQILTNPTQTFRLTNGYQAGSTEVYVNGALQRQAVDYTESNPATGELTLGTVAVGTVTVVYTAQIQAGPVVSPPLGPAPTDIMWFPDAPTTQTDQSGAISSFIVAAANAGKTAGFAPGYYRTEQRMIISGITSYIWAPGAIFKRFDDSVRYEIFRMSDCNLNVTGLGLEATATPSRYRAAVWSREDDHGWGILGRGQHVFRNCSVVGIYGDGWYLARSNDNDATSRVQSYLAEDCFTRVSGRNGWSLITGENIIIRRCSSEDNQLCGFDAESNRPDDVNRNILIEDFDAKRWMDQNPSTGLSAYAIQISAGFGSISVDGVTIRRVHTDRGAYALYAAKEGGAPHRNISVTGWRADSPANIDTVFNVFNWQQSDNDGLSLPNSGNV